jgi:hypothetical protein
MDYWGRVSSRERGGDSYIEKMSSTKIPLREIRCPWSKESLGK